MSRRERRAQAHKRKPRARKAKPAPLAPALPPAPPSSLAVLYARLQRGFLRWAGVRNAGPVKPPAITLESRIEFEELRVHREPNRPPLLGCTRVRRFLEVDDDTLRALEAIRVTPNLREAEALLLRKTGDEYDLVALSQLLFGRGFVKAIDGVPVVLPKRPSEAHPHLHAVPLSALRWMHHPATLATVSALVVAWVALLFLEPAVRSSRTDLFFLGRPSLILISTFGGLFALAYVHELAHFFMARSFGIEPAINVSHRFFIVVLQTDTTNAWVLPRRQQLLVFLAGLMFNGTLASLGTFALWGTHLGALPLEWAPALRFFVMLNLFPIIFQVFIFARTDLYYVLLVLTKERNLLQDSMRYVRFRAARLWRRLKRETGPACGACSRLTMRGDPLCFACGAPMIQRLVPFPTENGKRRRLFGFGVFFILGTMLGYVWFALVGVRILWSYVRMSTDFVAYAMVDPTVLLLVEALFLVVVTFGQLAAAAWFFGGRLKTWTAKLLPAQGVPNAR